MKNIQQGKEDVARLMAVVEKETGYRVVVGTTHADTADAEMVSAAPGHPVHVVNVSVRALESADYVVAAQCAMLLIQWSHPQGVPTFGPVPDKVEYAAHKAANWHGLAKLPASLASQTASGFVAGLIHQLRSTPAELMAMEYCHREYPGLREMQADAMARILRRNTGNLRPEVKEIAPSKIWTSNQILCAALAQGWCELAGDDTAMLPYRSIGMEAQP